MDKIYYSILGGSSKEKNCRFCGNAIFPSAKARVYAFNTSNGSLEEFEIGFPYCNNCDIHFFSGRIYRAFKKQHNGYLINIRHVKRSMPLCDVKNILFDPNTQMCFELKPKISISKEIDNNTKNKKAKKINVPGSQRLDVDILFVISEKMDKCPKCYSTLYNKEVKVKLYNNSNKFYRYFFSTVPFCKFCERCYITEEKRDALLEKFYPSWFYNKNAIIIDPSTFSTTEKEQKIEELQEAPMEDPQEESIDMLKKEELEIENEVNFNNNTENRQINNHLQLSNKIDQFITVYAISCHCLSCERNNHFPRMISYSIEVESMRKRVVDLPVERCNICGRFYINETVIETYEKKYGRLLIERKYEQGYKKHTNTSSYEYAEDTILSRCGYTAQEDNRSIRMRILEYILLSGKATKDEVMEILSSFITNRGDRCYRAKPKWEHDLKYVSQIDLNKCPKIHGFVFKMTDRSNHNPNKRGAI